jgi:hypothetical protein
MASAAFSGMVGCKTLMPEKKHAPIAAIPVVAKDQSRTSEDSLLMSMERTPCFGLCPTYKIEIYKKGFVLYRGYTYVENKGIYSTHLSAEDVKKLTDYANEIKYFELKDTYINAYMTDFPSTITTVKMDGQSKTINDGHEDTPSELVFLEKMIDDLVAKNPFNPIKVDKKPDPDPESLQK